MPKTDQATVTQAAELEDEFNIAPDISHIETEDDTPVDNLRTEKNERTLCEPLYSSWDGGGRKFLICANVGIFYAPSEPPVVPDIFLSMDVQVAKAWVEKRHRSYFIWEFGKPPEVAIEIVSNRKGGEAGDKMHIYSRIGVDHYVIFDPMQVIGDEKLRIYERRFQRYVSTDNTWFEGVGLGLRLWDGVFEGAEDTWLRWCHRDGTVVPSGAERAVLAQRQAGLAQQVAEQEIARRSEAEAEVTRLKAELDALRSGKVSAKRGKKA